MERVDWTLTRALLRKTLMDLRLLAALNAERAARRAAMLVTDIADGEQRLVRESGGRRRPARRRSSRSACAPGKSGLVEIDGQLRSSSPCRRRPCGSSSIGAVHISQALAPMARGLDLDVTIVDPRTAFATPERFPDVPVLAEWPDAALPRLGLDRYTALVALTHDPKIDDPALAAALRAECFYIGALGSKKTHARRVERLTAAGFARGGHRAHPCADRPRHRRRVSPAEIAVVDPRRDRRDAAPGPEARAVRFGPVPVEEAVGALAAHSVRAGERGREEGQPVTRRGRRAAAARPASTSIVAVRLEPGDVGEDEAALRLAEAAAGERCRRRAALHRTRQPLRAQPPACSSSTTACIDAHQRGRRGDHGRDAAGLQAGGRGRDDRHGQDHSLCRAGAAARARRSPCAQRRRRAVARRALCAGGAVAVSLDAAAGPEAERRRQDARRAAASGSSRPAPAIVRGGARRRTRPQRSHGELAEARAGRARSSIVVSSAPPPSPTGAT